VQEKLTRLYSVTLQKIIISQKTVQKLSNYKLKVYTLPKNAKLSVIKVT